MPAGGLGICPERQCRDGKYDQNGQMVNGLWGGIGHMGMAWRAALERLHREGGMGLDWPHVDGALTGLGALPGGGALPSVRVGGLCEVLGLCQVVSLRLAVELCRIPGLCRVLGLYPVAGLCLVVGLYLVVGRCPVVSFCQVNSINRKWVEMAPHGHLWTPMSPIQEGPLGRLCG